MRKLEITSIEEYIRERCQWVGECLIWQRACPNGYGVFQIPGTTKQVLAHRAMYEAVKGPLEPKQQVLHSCDTPLCCNPQHLQAGTNHENVSDAVRKGRRSGGVKLNKNDYDRIKTLFLEGGVSYTEIAAIYAVNVSTIKRIVKGQCRPTTSSERARKAAEARWRKK